MNRFFKRSEFECKCGCGFAAVDYELMAVLMDLRRWGRQPITITSGCRCKKHNNTIKGAAQKSQHIFGMAADIAVKDISADRVYDYLDGKHPDKYGLGRFDGGTHIDVREGKARWDNRELKGEAV